MLEVVEVPRLTSNHPLLRGILPSLDVLKQSKHLLAYHSLLGMGLCLMLCLLSNYPLNLGGLSLLLRDHLLK